MRIEIVTPAAAGSSHGNRVTAERWAGILADLGHGPEVTTVWSRQPVDAMVALHARRSSAAALGFARAHPGRPLVVALTGTDLYHDLAVSAEAQQTVERAGALVVLQPKAIESVPAHLRPRVHVIHQSVDLGAPDPAPVTDNGFFDVVVLGHLREVKDPFLTAEASRLLPAGSRVRVTHCGAPMDPGSQERARAETAGNPRYRWLGGVSRAEALDRLGASRMLVLTSRLEGGANVVSEALALGVPVLSTRVDGSVGLLGEDYPGFVEVGDAAGLAAALHRAETDPAFLADLTARVAQRRGLVDPARERRAWAGLLAALAG